MAGFRFGRALAAAMAICGAAWTAPAAAQHERHLGHVEDSSLEFQELDNTYFVAGRFASFDAATGTGLYITGVWTPIASRVTRSTRSPRLLSRVKDSPKP